MLKAGQILKERRLEKKLTLEDVSKATKIKVNFLEAIEKGNYTDLPSSSYAQGFVRNYAQFLGFAEREVMPIFRREFDSEKEFKVLPKGLAQKDDIPIHRVKWGRSLALLGVVFVLLIAYLLFQYRFAFINPSLTVTAPSENAKVIAQEIDVVGKTDPNSTVSVDDAAVSIDQSGNFKKSVDVFLGPATIKIVATSKFGKSTEVDRHIVVQSQ